jgi:hypothetical protein
MFKNYGVIIPFLIKNSTPLMKELSSMEPSAHHPALFLIQLGISFEPVLVP